MDPNSRTYYVSPNGSNSNPGTKDQPWKDISYAVSQQSPVEAGDTVLVQSGTYTETIDLEKSGNSQQGHITLKADGNVILRDPDPNQGGFGEGVIESSGSSYWVIDGFRIENTSWAGIALKDADNFIVQNNHTYETGASGIIVMPATSFGGGEAEVTSSNIQILDNTVERANWKWLTPQDTGSPQEALSIWGVDGFEVAGNLIKDTKKEGLDIKTGSRNGSVHGNVITGTALVSGSEESLRGGPALYVDGNRVDTFNIDIYNNVVFDNTADAIIIADEDASRGDVSDIRVYNNVVYNNGIEGVNGGVGIGLLHNVEDVEVVNNTVVGNVQGFVIDDNNYLTHVKSEDILIRNNIFADSGFRNGFVTDEGQVSNITIDNNLFTDEFDELFEQEGPITDLTVTRNETVESIGFVGAENGDFRLRASSAAVDNGSNQIGSYAQIDIEGEARPSGGGVDQGAFERQQVSPAPPQAPPQAVVPEVPAPAPPPQAVAPEVNGQLATAFIDSNNSVIGGAFQAGETYNGEIFTNTDAVFSTETTANDVIQGSSASDNIWTGVEGADVISAGLGNDTIGFGDGDSAVEAGAGHDFVYAAGNGAGENIVDLGGGNNQFWTVGGNNTITAGNGDDSIGLGSGTDQVEAGNGDNIIYLADGVNTSGSKTIIVGNGDDYVETGSGNDFIDAGRGFNVLLGNGGADVFVLKEGGYDYISDFEVGTDQLQLSGVRFEELNFFQGTSSSAADAFIAVESEIIAQLANVTVAQLENGANFL